MIDDLHDRRIARSATGLLADFNRAEVLTAADVHVAGRAGALTGTDDDQVLLAAALTVRAVRLGSVCLDLATVATTALDALDEPVELPWPSVEPWVEAVAASGLVEQEVLRLEGTVLYLDRYWREERQVCADLLDRLSRPAPVVDADWLEAALDRAFPDEGDFGEQRDAVAQAVQGTTTVLTGGPGTGKTTTVARLLAIVSELHEHETGRPPRIAMAAPTAKAAARLQESVGEQARLMPAGDRARVESLEASTLHRLLGWTPNPTRFRQHRGNRLPHDVVVVDETSMVSLTQMARLLEAVRPDARLVLVGDPDQLASIEAGAVLADVVEGLADHPARPVARLRTVHRFAEGGAIGRLAEALRRQDVDAVLTELTSGDASVELVDPTDEAAIDAVVHDVVTRAAAMHEAAIRGDAAAALAALDGHRLLCAHREGRFGVRGWNQRVERGLSEQVGTAHYSEWYAGRPVLVTANNQTLEVWNGDVGVAMRRPDGRLEVALAGAEPARRLATTRLPDVETMHATTVHKAQGSQATVVTVVMPPDESALLTRELFYTAVTRAEEHVRVLGTEASVRAAVAREAVRASGLAARLRA